jgi:hypothetical protein
LEDTQLSSGLAALNSFPVKARADLVDGIRRLSTESDALQTIDGIAFRPFEESSDMGNDLDVLFAFDEDMPFACGTGTSTGIPDTLSAFRYNDCLADPPVLQSFLRTGEEKNTVT